MGEVLFNKMKTDLNSLMEANERVLEAIVAYNHIARPFNLQITSIDRADNTKTIIEPL